MPFDHPTDRWLMPFLRRVSTRPGMYMGDESVKTLATYIQGYAQARIDLGAPEFAEAEAALLTDFTKWLARELSDPREVAWYTLIASEDPSEFNVRTFFRRFEQFLQGRGDGLSRPSSPTWVP